MPLNSIRAAAISDAIGTSFATIGRGGGTLMPRAGRGVGGAAAWEYYVASVLLKAADLRRERARRAAVAAGVLPDYAADPAPIGTACIVYAGALVTIAVKVVSQGDRIDGAGLVADLVAAGVDRKLLRKLVRKHTTSFAGAHTFMASLTAE
jgi:hypothetical protein